MKQSEALKKIKDIELEIEVKNRISNLSRARSVLVGTSFGGTTEISMRGDGSSFLYAVMQPVEVVELIHQLASNIGCSADVKPRKDFASWRDWRVSEAEKKHLNGHPPFVSDMAPFQQLGASGFNEEESKSIMDLIANTKNYANEEETVKIKGKITNEDGAPSLMIGEDDNLIHNKVLLNKDNEVVYMSGGNGGDGATDIKARAGRGGAGFSQKKQKQTIKAKR